MTDSLESKRNFLFWNNDKKNSRKVLEEIEKLLVKKVVFEKFPDRSSECKAALNVIWDTYASEMTCLAPPWRTNLVRIRLAHMTTKRDVLDKLCSGSICLALLSGYESDLNARLKSAAQMLDKEFSTKLVAGAFAAVGVAAITSNYE